MKKFYLITLVLLLSGSAFSRDSKFDYGLTPVNFSFPTGNNFEKNFKPSVGFGVHGFYNINSLVSVGLDWSYTFHFVNYTYDAFKINMMRLSPTIKISHNLGSVKAYLLLSWGLYKAKTEGHKTPAGLVGGKKSLTGGAGAEIGFMVQTAPKWELGAGAGYHYVGDMVEIKPARFFTAQIRASYKI